jgi:hypothetical protein
MMVTPASRIAVLISEAGDGRVGDGQNRHLCAIDGRIDRADVIVDVFALVVRRGECFWPPRSDGYRVSGQDQVTGQCRPDQSGPDNRDPT